ncbi:amino acid adenylation domain-containing protein [Kamptonema animale CS-326]|jgi:amino acid adenylation domain-containing protein/non-ribosomal peptide synthase protein (TIGR01720 family)|uniref:non-ribosomal peptide synthetase n=1 Tax=Kamptonema animale TaxID=92934 RepID=UPI00232ACB10|nr:non-ribosomal peptide synthetase [Kamptonema animale]MDB9510448.1 amino acid adenylation domain-containing protein [Kamptonema animale CS-326]
MQKQNIEGFRLSPQQKHLWLLQQNKGGFPDRVQGSIAIAGNLDKEVLKVALQNLTKRHEILRTTFHCLPGMTIPLQTIANYYQVAVSEYNLSALSVSEQETKTEWLFEELKQQDFDLQKLPLWKASLVTFSCKKHLLLISFSGMIADSATLKNFVNELSRTYWAYSQGEELSDEPMQYADIAEWENDLLEGEDTEAGREYWRNLDRSTIPNLKFLFEHKQSEKIAFKPQVLTQTFSSKLTAKIEALAKKCEVSTAKILLTSWLILLWRLLGKQEAIVGIGGDGRKYEELEPALGLLSKYLPFQFPLEADLTFREVLNQIEEEVEKVYQWQEYFSRDEIVGQDKFFPVCFQFDEKSAKYHSEQVSFCLQKSYTCVDRFKVKLSCLYIEDALIAEFHYDAGGLEAEAITRLSSQFQILLENATDCPETAISNLEILNDRARQQLLIEFNQTQQNYQQEKCIHQLFEEQAELTPDRIAVVFEDRQLTYGELNTRANQVANYLQHLGVKPDEIVALYVERSLETIVGIIGILKAGGAYLPIDSALPAENVSFRLEDAKVAVFLTQLRLIEILPKINAQIVCLDAEIPDFPLSSSSLSPSPQNLVYVIYTSGSTGKPKGVITEHRQLLNYINAISEHLELATGSSFATVSTFAADLGNTAIFSALLTGGCLHVISQDRASDPNALADYFSRHSIDYLKIVPSHLNALLTADRAENILPKKGLILGGETLNWKLIEKVQAYRQNCKIINHYGPTETTIGVLTYAIDNNRYHLETVPLGRPLANTQIYILDEHLQPVPVGSPGQLLIGGKGLARGYLNQLELTAEKFIYNPFLQDKYSAKLVTASDRLYKTGDLARYLPDGNIEFLGRIDEQVKIRGFRIEPGEIESALLQHPSIRETVVIAREDESSNKRLVAYFVPDQTMEFSVGELRNFLKDKLPEYMIPSAFVRLKALPLNPNGKIARALLPIPDTTRPELEEIFAAPRTPAEEIIAQSWAEVLELERVGIHDNFFELGGDSIVSIRIAARLNRTGLKVTPKQLFEYPTVAQLAGVADTTEMAEKSLPLTPIQQIVCEQPLSKMAQILFLEMRENIAPSLIKQAVQCLLKRHETLRLKFIQTSSGWQQLFTELDEIQTDFFSYNDLSELPKFERETALKTAAELQSSLNPAEGFLMRVALFNLGSDRPSRLLFIVHQLAVDNKSWQILLEEFAEAIAQLRQGKTIQLPEARSSFKQWCKFVYKYANLSQLDSERDYWIAQHQEVSKLPKELATNGIVETNNHPVLVALNIEETQTLFEKVLTTYRVQIDEVLLTALVQAFKLWTKVDSLLVDVEEDGRALAKEIDLSRTVGCFTTVFPLHFKLQKISQSAEALKAIKQQLRSVPNGGIGYGVIRYLSDDLEVNEKLLNLEQAEVKFSYKQPIPLLEPASNFQPIQLRENDGRSSYLIEIEGFIREERLQVQWRYKETAYRRTTIENLAQEFLNSLQSLVAASESMKTASYAPSDFPKANLNQQDLERFMAKLNRGKLN